MRVEEIIELTFHQIIYKMLIIKLEINYVFLIKSNIVIQHQIQLINQ